MYITFIFFSLTKAIKQIEHLQPVTEKNSIKIIRNYTSIPNIFDLILK